MLRISQAQIAHSVSLGLLEHGVTYKLTQRISSVIPLILPLQFPLISQFQKVIQKEEFTNVSDSRYIILNIYPVYLYYADLQTKDVPVGTIAGIVVSVSLLMVVLLSVVAFIVHYWRTKIGTKTSHHQSQGK